jgi:hypothetical protein
MLSELRFDVVACDMNPYMSLTGPASFEAIGMAGRMLTIAILLPTQATIGGDGARRTPIGRPGVDADGRSGPGAPLS